MAALLMKPVRQVMRVKFANDNAETLMKPQPKEVILYNTEDPPGSLLVSRKDNLLDQLYKSVKSGGAGAYVPPHLRKMTNVVRPKPGPLTRKPSFRYNLSLQCDEEFRPAKNPVEDDHSDCCPGCESGCDADDAHRSGHSGDGYHPDCYMNDESGLYM